MLNIKTTNTMFVYEKEVSCSGTQEQSSNKVLNHPKVFLKIENNDKAVCPYCNAVYIYNKK